MTALTVREPLPDGPETRIEAQRGSYVVVSVPRPDASSENVWRIARPYDSSVVRQISEAFVGGVLVVVFDVIGPGTTSIVLAMTLGETSEPLAASYFHVTVA